MRGEIWGMMLVSGGGATVKIMLLHHSTGHVVWMGTTSRVGAKLFGKSALKSRMDAYNKQRHQLRRIRPDELPATSKGTLGQLPYDYYNLWVKHFGSDAYKGEPYAGDSEPKLRCHRLEALLPGQRHPSRYGGSDVDSPEKRLENYKLQYAALKEKVHSFPRAKVIVRTRAALTEQHAAQDEAQRAKEFLDWVRKS